MFSLLQMRRAVATELGPFAVLTTTTAASTGTAIVCSTLADSDQDTSRFNRAWVYITSGALAAQQRRVRDGGYDRDTGQLSLTAAFSTNVQTSVGFEVLTVLPAIRTDENIGLREIINTVLESHPPIDLLPMTGVTGLSAYDVTAVYPWLTEKSQVLGIYYQDTGEDYPHEAYVSWDWLYDASAARLILPGEPYTTGETFYIKARRPAHTWIESSGVWGADTDGLNADADRALPLLPLVKAQTLAECYRHLGAKVGPDEYQAYYRERESFWSKKAFALRWFDDQKADEDVIPRPKMRWRTAGWGGRRGYS